METILKTPFPIEPFFKFDNLHILSVLLIVLPSTVTASLFVKL